jgi:hypothetical protein
MTTSLLFLADENFDNNIARGLLQRQPDLDLVRVQDVGLSETDDAVILEWAAQESRILLTHDFKTMGMHVYARVRSGLPMPGVFLVSESAAIGRAIEDLLLLAQCSLEGEWEGRLHFLSP